MSIFAKKHPLPVSTPMLQCKDSNEFVLQRVVCCTRKLIHSEINKTFFNKKKHGHWGINNTQFTRFIRFADVTIGFGIKIFTYYPQNL